MTNQKVGFPLVSAGGVPKESYAVVVRYASAVHTSVPIHKPFHSVFNFRSQGTWIKDELGLEIGLEK